MLEYISHLKNIQLDIVKCGFTDVEESFMTSILINGLPPSYKHFLETLQITSKLESQTFDSLSDLLVQHNSTFGKKKPSGEDLFFTNSRRGESSRGRGSYNEGTRGRGSYNDVSRGKGNNKDLSIIHK